jgi:hypothetical protein
LAIAGLPGEKREERKLRNKYRDGGRNVNKEKMKVSIYRIEHAIPKVFKDKGKTEELCARAKKAHKEYCAGAKT